MYKEYLQSLEKCLGNLLGIIHKVKKETVKQNCYEKSKLCFII